MKLWKNKSGVPEHVDFHMVTREIWEKDYRGACWNWTPAALDQETKDSLARRKAQGGWTHYGTDSSSRSCGRAWVTSAFASPCCWTRTGSWTSTRFRPISSRCITGTCSSRPACRTACGCSRTSATRIVVLLAGTVRPPGLPVLTGGCWTFTFVQSAGRSAHVRTGRADPGHDRGGGVRRAHPMEVKAGNDPLRIAAKYKDKAGAGRRPGRANPGVARSRADPREGRRVDRRMKAIGRVHLRLRPFHFDQRALRGLPGGGGGISEDRAY